MNMKYASIIIGIVLMFVVKISFDSGVSEQENQYRTIAGDEFVAKQPFSVDEGYDIHMYGKSLRRSSSK
jgi:hypothetical protein